MIVHGSYIVGGGHGAGQNLLEIFNALPLSFVEVEHDFSSENKISSLGVNFDQSYRPLWKRLLLG